MPLYCGIMLKLKEFSEIEVAQSLMLGIFLLQKT